MPENERCRLDRCLVERGLAGGREKAKELLAAGFVTVNGVPVTKPSTLVGETDTVVCTAPRPQYVGRGGLKLEKVLSDAVSPRGCVCMDVGASTGGFTDCMLQHGAAHVYAVDVGHDQLHPSLRADKRVTALEGTDVRSEALRQTVPAGTVDFVSVDVSFVSLAHILPDVVPFLRPGATVVCLIKPQFEAGQSGIGKKGIVKDPAVHRRVLDAVCALFARLRLSLCALTYSPITGGEGNIEYLAVLCAADQPPVPVVPADVVAEAFARLRAK